MISKQMPPFYLLAALTLLCVQPPEAFAMCTTPLADVTGDDVTDVIDVQCLIVTTMWSLAGADPIAPPICSSNHSLSAWSLGSLIKSGVFELSP